MHEKHIRVRRLFLMLLLTGILLGTGGCDVLMDAEAETEEEEEESYRRVDFEFRLRVLKQPLNASLSDVNIQVRANKFNDQADPMPNTDIFDSCTTAADGLCVCSFNYQILYNNESGFPEEGVLVEVYANYNGEAVTRAWYLHLITNTTQLRKDPMYGQMSRTTVVEKKHDKHLASLTIYF